jgi:hypothetical protein
LYVYLAAGGAVVVSLSGSDLVPVVVACVVVFVAAVVWGERVTVKVGLEESPEGYIDRNNFGRRLLRFEDIDHFDHRRTLSVDRVFAVRPGTGKADPIQGLVQGRRIVWDGGETRDIVGVLNERLEARRAARASRN